MGTKKSEASGRTPLASDEGTARLYTTMWQNNMYAKKTQAAAETLSIGVVTGIDKVLAIILYGRIPYFSGGTGCLPTGTFEVVRRAERLAAKS